jgi:hypothetical protein
MPPPPSAAPAEDSESDISSPVVRRANPSSAPWIIQKFGGTSLGKFAEGIAEEIVK